VSANTSSLAAEMRSASCKSDSDCRRWRFDCGGESGARVVAGGNGEEGESEERGRMKALKIGAQVFEEAKVRRRREAKGRTCRSS